MSMKSVPLGSIGLGLVLVILGFFFVPWPLADPGVTPAADATAIQARGQEHYDKIIRGQNLDRPFPPMPGVDQNPTTPEKVNLGRLLFFDPILSGDNSVSCAHCHHPDLGYADNRTFGMGKGGVGVGPARAGGTVLPRNTPTLWNAAYNHRQFWDGRATHLEDQAAKPIQDAIEMAQDSLGLVAELQAVPAYGALFKEAFGAEGDITFARVTQAIAAFERTLTTTDAPYDRYARGDRQALHPSARRGLTLFRSLKTRCFECHNLPTFNNPDFKVIGVPDPDSSAPDLGRGALAGEAYARAFKVPTLRNVALTAPYMHNGRFQTLGEVIDFYAGGGGAGLGLALPNLDDKIRPFSLSAEEKQDMVAFLHSLTDESNKGGIPREVPSGLPVVSPLPNQSPELVAFTPPPQPRATTQPPREGQRLLVRPGEVIQRAIDVALPGDTVMVFPGVYHETLTIDVSDLTLLGVEVEGDRPVLDGRNTLTDGVIGSGSNLEFRGFDVKDYTANGLMIDLGTNITFRDLYVENTGLYGVYPVEVVGVLVERTTVTGVRDAGIYVGQSKDIIVRDNKAFGNVTGIEIENSVNALVENNEVYDNTGGVLVFMLPNNPSKLSRNCRVVGNRIYENNRPNFGDPTAVVSMVPAGTGVLLLAADEVEVTQNEIWDNNSYGVAMISMATAFGEDAAFDVDPYAEHNWIHGNTLLRNGLAPDEKVTSQGFDGADLVWDVTGQGNRWDQQGVSKLPPVLPSSTWGSMRWRANYRLWRLAMALQ